jgi:hypothetical protein
MSSFMSFFLDEFHPYTIKVEEFRKKKATAEQEYRNAMPASSYQQQKLRVCEVCSAYLGIHDNDRRLADHFGGKLHLGFIKIREKLAELQVKHNEECFLLIFQRVHYLRPVRSKWKRDVVNVTLSQWRMIEKSKGSDNVSVREKIVKENVRERGKGTDGERDVVHAIDHRNDLVTDVKMEETDPVHPLPVTNVVLPPETLASIQKTISITKLRGILKQNIMKFRPLSNKTKNPEISTIVQPLFY